MKTLHPLLPLALGSASALLVSAWLGVLSDRPARASSEEEEPPVFTEPLPIAPEVQQRERLLEQLALGAHADQLEAAVALVAEDTEDWPEDYRGAVLAALAPAVLVASITHQVPPSVTLGQAIQESGWGRSSLAARHNNLFGVKARSGFPSVTLRSAEVRAGRSVATRASFAVFESWDQAVDDHGALLSHPRYAAGQEQWTDWSAFLTAIAPIYASDPLYVSRISSLIESYDLDRWDWLVVEVVDRASTAPEGVLVSNTIDPSRPSGLEGRDLGQ